MTPQEQEQPDLLEIVRLVDALKIELDERFQRLENRVDELIKCKAKKTPFYTPW